MPIHKALDILRLQMETAMQKEKYCIHIKNDYKPGTFHLISPEAINKVLYIQGVFANQKNNDIQH